jgi:hypothetical protein
MKLKQIEMKKLTLFLLFISIFEFSCQRSHIIKSTYFASSSRPLVKRNNIKVEKYITGGLKKKTKISSWTEKGVVCGGSFFEERTITYLPKRKISSNTLKKYFSSASDFEIDKLSNVKKYDNEGQLVKETISFSPLNDPVLIDAFNIADLVCKGKVISKKEISISEVLPNIGKKSIKVSMFEIEIRNLYKGKIFKENIQVYSLIGGVLDRQQFPFEIGKEYLIFAIKNEYKLDESGKTEKAYSLHPYESTKELSALKNGEIKKLELLMEK